MNAQIDYIKDLPIIGYHRSPLTQKFGTPRQPNLVQVFSTIDFVLPFGQVEAFAGIEQYSHLWVFWQFHHNKSQANFRPQVRPPRLGGNDKIGVFATRSMYRPSELGLSVVQLDRVEVVNGRVLLHIIGADMIDGTPIIDIKPYLPYADSLPHATSTIDIPSVKAVKISGMAQVSLTSLVEQGVINAGDVSVIQSLVAQDPRPAYRQNETDTTFTMRYKACDVRFFMDNDKVLIVYEVIVVE